MTKITYQQALKKYNELYNGGNHCLYKKGTPQYDKVKELQDEMNNPTRKRKRGTGTKNNYYSS